MKLQHRNPSAFPGPGDVGRRDPLDCAEFREFSADPDDDEDEEWSGTRHCDYCDSKHEDEPIRLEALTIICPGSYACRDCVEGLAEDAADARRDDERMER